MRASSSLRVNWGRLGSPSASRLVPRWPLLRSMTSLDRSVVVELEALGLRERSLEVVARDLAAMSSSVRCDGGDRNAFVVGGVLGIEGTRAVQADPRDALRDAGAVTSGRGASY